MDILEYIIMQDEVMVTNKKDVYKDIVSLLHGHECPILLIDFKNVGYIDSSGMGMLLELHRTLRGKLYLYNFNEKVFELFGLTSLLDMFNIFPSKEEIMNELESKK